MASSLDNDLRFNNSIELARTSKRLIPEIQHWCSHLKIQSEYGGLIGKMGLPTMNYVSCPQANGGGGMNLEWVANDFIIQNCQNCQSHAEVFHKNFGRIAIERHRDYKEKQDCEQVEEEKIINEVRSKIKGKILDRFKSSKTTEVSILKLVDKLNDAVDRLAVAQSVLESSKLKPAFFNSLALDYLVLFLDDENISPEISQALVNVVLLAPDKLSDFSRERVKDSIARGENHNDLVQLAACLQLQENEELLLIDMLLKKYTIEDIRGHSDPFENPQPFIIKHFKEFYDCAPENFISVIESALKHPVSLIRKNVCFILYQSYLVDRNMVTSFFDKMILAFNVDEDEDGGADWAICRTLIKFCYTDCNLVQNSIDNCFSKLSKAGKVQILKFYDNFLKSDDLRESFPEVSDILIDKIIGFAGKNELEDDLETPYSVLRNLTRSYPAKFNTKFETFVGFLITTLKEKNTFNWYKENLDTNTATFNPLTNLNVYEIMEKETKISSKLSNVREMISYVLEENQYTNFENVIKIIRNLDSKKDEESELKIYLIDAVRSAKCSNINLVQILPDLYNWILDMNALAVRMEALKLLAVLVEKHFEILPQTLIDLLQILINDTEVVIKKLAIDAYGEILVKKPAIIREDTINFLIDQYDSRYIGIHQAMSGLTYKLFEILPTEKHGKLYSKIILLLHAHSQEKDKKQDLYENLFRQALFLNRKINGEKFATFERNIVENYLIPDCYTHDFYKGEKAIKTLTDLRRKNDALNDLWLRAALNFIYKYQPHRHEGSISNSFRKDYYKEMYKLKRSEILKEFVTINDYIGKYVVDADLYDYDTINMLNVLGYFSLHTEIRQLCDNIISKVIEVPSLTYFFRVVNGHKFLSELAASSESDTLPQFLQNTK
ncbi:hypothetical protein [Flavobacterium sp. WC2409]|uniref:Uncharacterized protein n=2 Tax=unclassified Flavobacterium TaxID=196869 RepID=A0AB39W9U3_9FLAO